VTRTTRMLLWTVLAVLCLMLAVAVAVLGWLLAQASGWPLPLAVLAIVAPLLLALWTRR
jgi:hypothetical protein